ncbi:phage tail tube protein [Photobacterium damselae subsp. damselae]|uniref:phage tail tube protein n=1 Tax=Photobacterium damselae TaxID=38293 RepID=UPI001F43EBBB|nr:phage tail tube protein [Photobacterium damselae]UKA27192.1 phage tail tube protein [Photobacterium damselae subsp. damselae]
MANVVGSVRRVTLDGRDFPVANDAETGRKLGGYENTRLMNGDGTSRLQKTMVAASLSGLALALDSRRSDQEFLQDLANLFDDFPLEIEYVDGSIYAGTGQIEGEISWNSMEGTAEIENISATSLKQI